MVLGFLGDVARWAAGSALVLAGDAVARVGRRLRDGDVVTDEVESLACYVDDAGPVVTDEAAAMMDRSFLPIEEPALVGGRRFAR